MCDSHLGYVEIKKILFQSKTRCSNNRRQQKFKVIITNKFPLHHLLSNTGTGEACIKADVVDPIKS